MTTKNLQPPPSSESLEAKQSALPSDFPADLWLRIYRAVRWLRRAEMERESDPDARFIFYWIAFNAAYAREIPGDVSPSETEAFNSFFDRVALTDQYRGTVHRYVFSSIPQTIIRLVANRFVYRYFWSNYNDPSTHRRWRQRLAMGVEDLKLDMEQRNTSRVLSTVFDRLYVLRNQLVHGGATWNSSVNRKQVTDGANIMAYTVPAFIDLMMDNPAIFSDGRPYFPVVGKPSGPGIGVAG